jgi:hypothetical protein
MALADEFSQSGVELRNPVWRVSDRRYEPMIPPPRSRQGLGRFDDLSIGARNDEEGFAVLYCAEHPKSAFIEILDQHRPRLDHLHTLITPLMLEAGEREQLLREFGSVPRDWMDATQLTSVEMATSAPIFDLANPASVQLIRERLGFTVLALGLDDLDFSHVLGNNRDLTRAISHLIWAMTTESGQPLFSGIRYRSRFDPECICLALYENRYTIEGDIDVQPITPDTPGFAEAASILRLAIA